MKPRLVFTVVFALALVSLSAGATGAQQLASVTVAATRPGNIQIACPPGQDSVTPPVFTLTRTGDISGEITVTLVWRGPIVSFTTVSPGSATFSAGSATTSVTPSFGSVPQSSGLGLTITPGTGYEPGNPSSATADFTIVTPSCIAQSPPPPVLISPALTG